jgi:hypothetical protein
MLVFHVTVLADEGPINLDEFRLMTDLTPIVEGVHILCCFTEIELETTQSLVFCLAGPIPKFHSGGAIVHCAYPFMRVVVVAPIIFGRVLVIIRLSLFLVVAH